MRYLYSIYVLFVLGLLPCTASLAQTNELQTIVVVAESEPETGDVQHEEHTGSHQRILKQDLERADVNLGDILSKETGVQFRQIGGLGSLTTVTLRAASSQQTNVFLDGILLNSAGNSTVDLSLLDLLSLDSVDVYQGASPMQLANGNIGGAVNLSTISTRNEKAETSARINVGSFNTSRLQTSHRSSHKKWDVVAAASREHSKNNFTFTNDNATPLNLKDDRREKRNNAQTDKLSTLSRIGYQWNKNTRSDLLIQGTKRELGIPEWLNSENNIASYDTNGLELQLTNRFDGLGNWNTALSFFNHSQNNHYLDALYQISLRPRDTSNNTNTTGVKSYWEHIGDKGTFSVNTTFRKETLNTTDNLYDVQNFIARRNAMNAGVQYAYFAFDNKLLLTPSVRIQTVDDTYNGIRRHSSNTHKDRSITPQIGVRYTHNDSLTLRSNIGKFVREPSFSELFSSRGLIVGNSNLSPEKGTNADFGASWEPSEKYELNATVFASWRDELIVLAFNSQGVGRSVNAGKATVYGIELGNDFHFSKNLSARFNSTYQLTQNFSPNPALNKNELPGEARFSTHAKVQYKTGKKRTWIETDYKSDYFYGQANLLAAKANWTYNAGFDMDWKAFTFGFTVNNIGDQNVEDFNGFARPGRAYYFSLTYQHQ